MLTLSAKGQEPLSVTADPLVLAERAFSLAKKPWSKLVLGAESPEGRRYAKDEIAALKTLLAAAKDALDPEVHFNESRELARVIAYLKDAESLVVEV